MRQSDTFLYTLREAPADAEVPSHRLLAQAGFIHKLCAGVYCYAPAMWRVLKKVSEIVREEMDRAGAQEVMLPALQPKEIWEASGRWERYTNDGILFHFKDRKESEVCLGPTHEEVTTTLANKFINSYKQLPLNLYQIQTKFRDEIRPRFGLMRGREFIMKDAYSFDVDDAGLDVSYKKMAEAYRRIFTRCGLEFTVVDADSGAIGGSASQEFIVTAETGEDLFLVCDATGYAANQERAVSLYDRPANAAEPEKPLDKIHTPQHGTVEELRRFLPDFTADRILKTIIYKAVYSDRDVFVGVMIRGDQDINEIKLGNLLDCLKLSLADDVDVERLTGAKTGFAGPIKLTAEVKLFADESVKDMRNFLCGANETDYHYINVNWGRDFVLPELQTFRLARAGELAVVQKPEEEKLPVEARRLRATRGIEVGHIFKLGTKYSKAMGAGFTAEDGKPQPFVMGCYGIGVSRVAASAVEQCHDEKGIIWPREIAPWTVHLVCLNPKREEQRRLAEDLYERLCAEKFEVLFDDRELSPGVKFNDADLIGLPFRIVVGRDAAESVVEFSTRQAPEQKRKLSAADVPAALRQA